MKKAIFVVIVSIVGLGISNATELTDMSAKDVRNLNISVTAPVPQILSNDAETKKAGVGKQLNCRIYATDPDQTWPVWDDMTLSGSVINDQKLRNVILISKTETVNTSKELVADSNYKPSKPGRKTMNRFSFEGYGNIYLPKDMTIAGGKFKGEIEIKASDGGASRAMYCTIK